MTITEYSTISTIQPYSLPSLEIIFRKFFEKQQWTHIYCLLY